ncbi:MAG: hypothetical protein RDU83_02650 [bacterium]|nr:hypothetical protein [bacterium]
MDRSLLLGVFILGLLGWIAGWLLIRRERADGRRFTPVFAVAAFGALVLIAALTIPGRALWPAGQGWGHGAVLGGLAALLAGWVALPAGNATSRSRGMAAIVASYFAAVAAAAGVLLWLRPTLVDSLIGAASGWLLVSLILALGAIRVPGPASADTASSGLAPSTLLAAGTGFAVTLFATAAMGHYRDTAASEGAEWSIAAVILAAGVPLIVLVTGLLASAGRGGASRSGRSSGALWTLLGALLLAALAYIVGQHILMQPRFVLAAAVGLVAPFILWWLTSEGMREARGGSRSPANGLPVDVALAALVVLGATVASFYLLIGYGVGVMLVAAWLPAGVVLALGVGRAPEGGGPAQEAVSDPAARITSLLTLGVIVLLYRLFLQRFQTDLSGAVLTDHFAIFTLIAGAVAPSLLAGMLSSGGGGGESPGRGLMRLLFVLVVALALPGALLVLWGARAAIGLLAGLALSCAIVQGGRLHALVALALALPLTQWSHEVLRVADLPRAEKLRVLGWLAAVVLVAILAVDYWPRIAGWWNRRRELLAAEGAQK